MFTSQFLRGSSKISVLALTSTITYRFLKKSSCEENQAASSTSLASKQDGAKLIFIGTGSSTGCPKPICSLLFPPGASEAFAGQRGSTEIETRDAFRERCNVSRIASIGDPKYNKNYRNNPSLLISHKNQDDKEKSDVKTHPPQLRNVIIDVGKTFREGALRWMPHHRVTSLDAVVITHGHADAMLGLDDIRGFQKMPNMISSDRISNSNVEGMPVFMSSECFECIKQKFDYLVPLKSTKRDGSKKQVKRAVAALDFQVIDHFKPFIAAGLKMVPLPVWHGSDFICNGYAFTVIGQDGPVNVVYLSDISEMMPKTAKFILEELPSIDILVVDSLLYDKPHAVHYSLTQAIDLAKVLKPKRTFIVGINCDDFPEHDQMNDLLKGVDIDVQLAHDGLSVEV